MQEYPEPNASDTDSNRIRAINGQEVIATESNIRKNKSVLLDDAEYPIDNQRARDQKTREP